MFVFMSLGEARPPREIPSAMTASEVEAYLSGEPQTEILSAETFGYPDPRRVVTLEKQLELTAEQLEKAVNWAGKVRRETALLGKKIIEQELFLDDYFRKGQTDYPALANRVESIGTLRWRLRLNLLHLYILTRELLTEEQLKKYHELKTQVPGMGFSK